MTPYIEEAERLLRVARRDYQTLAILHAHPEAPAAPICFHAQQCVEKALKAVITAHQIYFRYTHDLAELVRLLDGAGITPPFSTQAFQRLTPAAVELRYDEGIPLLTRDEAEQLANQTLAWATTLIAAAAA
jgi:HEPN domain-containing protein